MIAQVQGAANTIVTAGLKPNLVLINAGTNDCLQRSNPAMDPATAPDRLRSLIQVCLYLFTIFFPNRDRQIWELPS